jgi:hypothetical protein
MPVSRLEGLMSYGGCSIYRRFLFSMGAAVIATACPVPDLFAAAFAKVFYEFFLRGLGRVFKLVIS